MTTGKLVGVVGAATSGVTTKMANFLKLFKIPQVSFLMQIQFAYSYTEQTAIIFICVVHLYSIY